MSLAPTAPTGATAPHRALADLPIDWATESTVAELVAAAGGGAAERSVALAAFRALPTEANLLFTGYVDLRAAELDGAKPAALKPAIGELPASALPSGAAAVIEVSARGVAAHIGAAAQAAGLAITTMPAATPLAGVGEDRMSALIGALWNVGVRIGLASGSIDAPVIVRFVAPAAGGSLLARTAIDLGPSAHLSVVEEIGGAAATPGPARALLAATSEVSLAANARLDLSSIQQLPEDCAYIVARRHEFGAGAEMHLAAAQIGARLVRGRIDHHLAGNGAAIRQVEVVFGSGDQLHDLTTYSLHTGEKTIGDLLAKGVFGGKSRGFVKGVTTIPRSGRGTNSYLGEFGMLLSKTARSVAIPSLWIDQPNCERVAHGSSVGPIDPAQIFYLRSRGYTEAEARRAIVMGFLEPVVAALPLEDEADRLREALAAKLETALVER